MRWIAMTDGQESTDCTECGGRIRRYGTEYICDGCGLITGDDTIDRGPEWRNFADGEDRKRTGAPLTRSRHDRGLSTEIGYPSNKGQRLSGRKRRQLARLRREHRRARLSSKIDRNRMYGFTEIRRIISQLSLPSSILEQSCMLFESAQNEGLFTGRSLEGFAAASVYAVCRTNLISRTVDEVVAVARADSDELRAAYRALNRELGLETGPIDPTEFIPRYADQLDLSESAERKAMALVEDLQKRNVTVGRNPSGVAAACLYAAAHYDDPACDLTQSEAASVANVAPVTIRSTLYDLPGWPSNAT